MLSVEADPSPCTSSESGRAGPGDRTRTVSCSTVRRRQLSLSGRCHWRHPGPGPPSPALPVGLDSDPPECPWPSGNLNIDSFLRPKRASMSAQRARHSVLIATPTLSVVGHPGHRPGTMLPSVPCIVAVTARMSPLPTTGARPVASTDESALERTSASKLIGW
jgi:hypothetical protein